MFEITDVDYSLGRRRDEDYIRSLCSLKIRVPYVENHVGTIFTLKSYYTITLPYECARFKNSSQTLYTYTQIYV